MDISALAATLVGFLTPALPYLVKGGEKALEAVSEKIGEDVWESAKAIWQRLRGKLEASPAALEAAQDLAGEPDDGDAQAALRRQLKKLLSSDDALATEIARLLEEGEKRIEYRAKLQGEGAIAQGAGAVAAGKGGVAVGGDVHGGVRLGGSGAERDEE